MSKLEIVKKNREMTVTEVSELLPVSARQVRNWIKEKGLPARDSERGKILNWHETLDWYITHIAGFSGNRGNRSGQSSENLPESDEETYEEALTRKTRAEADLKQLILARQRAEVVAISDVERAVARSNKSIQTLIQAFPAALAPQLLGMDDRAKVFALLQRECNALLTNLTAIDAIVEAEVVEDADDAEAEE